MDTLTALDSGDITKVGVGVTIGLVVIGLLLSLVITAIVGRIILLIVVVVLAAFVWQQRSVIENHVKKCELSMSFFGVKVHAPKDVVQACHDHSRK